MSNPYRQKFKESLSGDPEKDAHIALELTKEFEVLALDPQLVQSYLQFALATRTYDPADRFNGNAVLVQAMDAPPHPYFIPNNDYNVSKVILQEIAALLSLGRTLYTMVAFAEVLIFKLSF